MRTRAAILLAVAATATGCGASKSTAGNFKGEAGLAAKAVEDIQAAASKRDAAKICRDLISKSLRAEVAAGGTSCDSEVKKAIDDADAFELEVEKVTVTGNQAVASVRNKVKDGGAVRDLAMVKEDGAWRAASFGANR
jgi:hypothetical protein